MQNIAFHSATKADIVIIQNLIQSIWKPTYQSILSEEQMDYMLEMMYSTGVLLQQFDEGHQFVLISLNAAPVGFAGYQFDATVKGICKLHKIYVLPDTHGKGIGQALFRYVTKKAADGGQHKLILNVNRYNKALGFYEKAGMLKEAEVDVPIGKGYFMNDYIMGLSLT